jgi:hypothetical protein
MEQQLHTRPHQGMATVLMPCLRLDRSLRDSPSRPSPSDRRPRHTRRTRHKPNPPAARSNPLAGVFRWLALVGLRLHQGLPCVGEAGLARLASSGFVVIRLDSIGSDWRWRRINVWTTLSMTPVAVILLCAVDITTQIDMQVIKALLSCTSNRNHNHSPSPSSIHPCIARPQAWSSTSKPPQVVRYIYHQMVSLLYTQRPTPANAMYPTLFCLSS